MRRVNSTEDKESERAILVHVITDQAEREQVWERAELVNLVQTAGADVVGDLRQSLAHEHAAAVIGSGKLEELVAMCAELDADVVIFNVDLSGSQARNIETACEVRVIDRTQLILDIFAMRARSFEGKAQVELAQLSYLLPRLIGHGLALSRQGGGIGTRGPGETKLETDRRKIRKAISDLRKVVRAGGDRRLELRRRRARQGVFSIGIVGYTNAGKTTLLANLSRRFGEKPAGEGNNRLFDTLDLTTRRIEYNGRTFVLTDTVGFIRQLPHHLIDAFRSTLEEAVDADALIHVVDVDDPFRDEKMDAVHAVLEKDLHASVPMITLMNCKRPSSAEDEASPLVDPRAVATVVGSARAQSTWDDLLEIVDRLVGERVALHLCVPHERSDVLAQAYRAGRIGPILQDEQYLRFDLEIDRRLAHTFLPFADERPMEAETMYE